MQQPQSIEVRSSSTTGNDTTIAALTTNTDCSGTKACSPVDAIRQSKLTGPTNDAD
jgi:hypothetical protein